MLFAPVYLSDVFAAQCPATQAIAPGAAIATNPGSKNYANNAECTWTMTVPASQMLVVSFSAFNTEATYDFFRIFLGSSSGTLLAELSGTFIPAPVLVPFSVTAQSITFTFTSNGNTEFSGVIATTMLQAPWVVQGHAYAVGAPSTWPAAVAGAAAQTATINGTLVRGHLATITSTNESNAISTLVQQFQSQAASLWIAGEL